MVKALAAAFRWKFKRVQFTPDLMPSDITGYELLSRDEQTGQPRMTFRLAGVRQPVAGRRDQPGGPQDPVGPARGDGRETRDGRRRDYELAEPFLVVATQNPIEQEGTYPCQRPSSTAS